MHTRDATKPRKSIFARLRLRNGWDGVNMSSKATDLTQVIPTNLLLVIPNCEL